MNSAAWPLNTAKRPTGGTYCRSSTSRIPWQKHKGASVFNLRISSVEVLLNASISQIRFCTP